MSKLAAGATLTAPHGVDTAQEVRATLRTVRNKIRNFMFLYVGYG
jgi:hypothetical protein